MDEREEMRRAGEFLDELVGWEEKGAAMKTTTLVGGPFDGKNGDWAGSPNRWFDRVFVDDTGDVTLRRLGIMARYTRGANGKFYWTEHDPANPWPRDDRMRERWAAKDAGYVRMKVDFEAERMPDGRRQDKIVGITDDHPRCACTVPGTCGQPYPGGCPVHTPRKSIAELNAEDVEKYRAKFAEKYAVSIDPANGPDYSAKVVTKREGDKLVVVSATVSKPSRLARLRAWLGTTRLAFWRRGR